MWPFKLKFIKTVQAPKEIELVTEEWTPVPGYEKYYVQNTEGNVKSLGNEFDFHIENGASEEKAAYYTMRFLQGYIGRDSVHSNNVKKIVEVMEKNLGIKK